MDDNTEDVLKKFEPVALQQFTASVRNRAFAEAYCAVRTCISQKSYCQKIGVNESRFSRVLTKVEQEKAGQPTGIWMASVSVRLFWRKGLLTGCK